MARLLALPAGSRQATTRRIVGLAEGSIGRALALAAGDGVAVAGTGRSGAGGSVPDLPMLRAHEVADRLGREESAFSTFMDLLRAGVAAAVRDAARGRADPDQARLLGARPLDAWVDVWHALTRLQDETEGARLDKRQALVAGFGWLAGKTPGMP